MGEVAGVTHTVVVGVDESESTADAVVWAAREAARRHAELRLVLAFTPGRFPARTDDGDGRAEAQATLDAARALALEVAPGVRLSTLLVDGLPVPVLAEQGHRSDLLVIGSHGASGLSVAVLGSTARELAAGGPGPVIVVSGPDPESLPEAGVLPVVVGVDGSEQSRRAAHFAAEEARLTHVPLVVAHVDTDPATDKSAALVFESLLTSYPGEPLEYRRLVGSPADALVDCSSEARLLVVGSRGKGGLVGLFGGSVSQILMRRAQCPVAVVPPTMRARAWAERGGHDASPELTPPRKARRLRRI